MVLLYFFIFFIAELIQNYQHREVRQGVQTNKQTIVPNRKQESWVYIKLCNT